MTTGRRRGLPALLAASCAAGCAAGAAESRTGEPAPFAFEAVDFTAECAPNAAFDRLLTVLLPRSAAESDDALPAFDEPLFDAVSGHTEHVLRFAEPRPWHGLRLAEVRLLSGIESGPSNHSLAFADSPERVREVWNARGWDLPPAGATRVVSDEAIRVAVGIEAGQGLAAVTCFSD